MPPPRGDKRSAPPATSESPETTVPIKRIRKMISNTRSHMRAGAPEIDLVYPFGYVTEPVGLNPPFLEGSGPLVDQDGKLTLRVTTPIVIANNSVALAHDPSLTVDGNGQLAVAVEPEGALDITPDGLEVKVDNVTVEVNDDWELAVKLDPNGCIESTSTGLDVNVDDTLLVEPGTDGKPELGVHLNTMGPITADSNGIDLEVNQNMFTINTSSGAGVLELKLKTTGGLQVGTSGLGVAVDQSLQITNNTLEVKPDPAGPLAVTDSGLTLQYDTSEFTMNGGKLTLIPNPSPAGSVLTLTSGSPNLNNATAKIISLTNSYKCSYYLQQWNQQGLLTTSLYVKIDSATMGTRPSSTSHNEPFIFWVSSYTTECNPSALSAATVLPSGTNSNLFEPLPNRANPTVWNYKEDEYYSPDSGIIGYRQIIFPTVTQNFATGTITITTLPMTVIKDSERYNLLCYRFEPQYASIFDNTKQGTLIIGPIMYSCPGQVP